MNYLMDYEEFFKLLNKNEVKYLIVGAYAFSYYSRPRATGDVDIWISKDSKNAEKFYKSIKQFGINVNNITSDKFEGENILFSFGREPYAIEIFTRQGMVDFIAAWKARKRAKFGDITVNYVSKKHLIAIKEFYHRVKDKADLQNLRKK